MANYYVKANASYLQASCTADNTTNTFTCSSHGLSNGDVVTFTTSTTLPTGITRGDTYYVISAAPNTFQVETTLGGGAVDFTTNGSGVYVSKITGSGTSGDPWVGKGVGVILYAIRQGEAATWGTTGNTLYMSNEVKFVFPHNIDETDLPTTTLENPFMYSGWDNGGTIVVRTFNGDVPGCEWDGEDAIAGFISGSGKTYVTFHRIKAHGTTSSGIGLGNTERHLVECELYDCGAGAAPMVNGYIYCRILGCCFRDPGVSSVDAINFSQGTFICQNNIFEDITGTAITVPNQGLIDSCLIARPGESGILITADLVTVTNCIIDGNGTASTYGINFSAAAESGICASNLVTNWSGASSVGIRVESGGVLLHLGPNFYYNNTTDLTVSGVALVNHSAADIDDASDPYINRALDDYSIKSTAACVGLAEPTGIQGGPATNRNPGPFQFAPGSTGESAFVFFE